MHMLLQFDEEVRNKPLIFGGCVGLAISPDGKDAWQAPPAHKLSLSEDDIAESSMLTLGRAFKILRLRVDVALNDTHSFEVVFDIGSIQEALVIRQDSDTYNELHMQDGFILGGLKYRGYVSARPFDNNESIPTFFHNLYVSRRKPITVRLRSKEKTDGIVMIDTFSISGEMLG